MIREATPDDAEDLARIYRYYVLESTISFENDPPDAAEFRERLAAANAWLVAEDEGEIVGFAYAGQFHKRAAYAWSTEVSIYLDVEHTAKGIGRELLGTLLPILKDKGFVNVFAGIALPNDASQKIFESFGFRRAATYTNVGYKMNQWLDVGWWQLELVDPPETPQPLIRS